MGNRRGKLDKPYLAISSGILLVVIIASLFLFPEWRQSPAAIAILLVTAAAAVVSFASGFRSAFMPDHKDELPATLDYDSPQHRHNQENVCANVRTAWIDGVLRDSLPERVRLELAFDSLPDMLQRRIVVVEGQERRREPVDEIHFADLFRSSGRALLILGAPGSGKTFTLLELCKPLLEGAEADPRRPVPVVLNLSTWAQKQAPLADWIVDEMWRQYDLNKQVTPVWLTADHLTLLLDGLDEVAADARDACVRAINAFRESHGGGMAVCSRSADYADLRERLALSRAVEILPLAPEQIDVWLSDERLALDSVREAIARDDALGELATTPLMLNIMAVAYGGRPFDELQPLLEDEGKRRAHLYDAYIARMFRRKPPAAAGYSSVQALRRLRFLAARLTAREETQFFIEGLQPDWLPGRWRHWVGILVGALVGVLFGVLINGLYSVLFGGLFGVLIGVLGDGKIKPVDELGIEFSIQNIQRAIKDAMLSGVLYGVLYGILFGVLYIVLFGRLHGIVYGVLFGMLFSVLFSVLLVMVRLQESNRRNQPNDGIRRSIANAARGGFLGIMMYSPLFSVLFGALLGTLFGMLAGVLFDMLGVELYGLLYGMRFGIRFGVRIGVLSGILFGVLFYGGTAVLKHYTLRLLLAAHRLLPLRLVPFLEAMRERILLQRAGGHYRFIHRTLQEHIAALTDERIERLA